MKSIMFAAQQIMLGQGDLIIAGGMESMSNIPFYLDKARWGYKFGEGKLIDGLQKDGLIDAYDKVAMGVSADATAEKYGISREDQDRFAIQSYERSAAATAAGLFKDEIVPVSIPQRKGEPLIISEDEEFKKVKFEKIAGLRAAFTKEGTATAANSSTINDGASALVIASEEAILKHGLTPIARIVSFADVFMLTGPIPASKLALKQSNLNIDEIDLYEVNEAFAPVPMAWAIELNISENIVNVNGGAVSLGHPLGCSGARIVVTLLNVLKQNGRMLPLCNGGGGASAIVLEKI